MPRKNSQLIPLAAIFFSGIVIAAAYGQGPKLPPSAVLVEEVQEALLEQPQRYVGTVMPRRRSIVGSAVDGRVEQYLVRVGDWVTEKQPLAQLLTETLKIEIAGAEAELQLREQEHTELKNGSLPEELTQAKAKMDQAKSHLEFAHARQLRWKTLFEQGAATSREGYEEVQSLAVTAEQQLAASKAAYELVVKGPRAEKVAQAYARVLVAREQLRLLNDRLAKFTIRSPFQGYVVSEFTEVGAWINKGDRIAEVIELDPVEVEVSVPEDKIAGLQKALANYQQKAEQTPATLEFNSQSGETFSGVITRIVPQADLRSRTFPVKVQVSNPRLDDGKGKQAIHLLQAGMLANVVVPTGLPQKSLIVPKDALVLGGPTPLVYAIVPGEKDQPATVRAVSVKTGLSHNTWIQVFGELQTKELVVVRGNERLRPGQPVIPQRK